MDRGANVRRGWGVAAAAGLEAAWTSMRSNRLRTGLTVLGVVIGVAAVIVLVAFGAGAQQEITAQIDQLGPNVAVVMPGKLQGQKNFNPLAGVGLSNLSDGDVKALSGLPEIRRLSPLVFVVGGVFRDQTPAGICIPIGIHPEFEQIRRLEIQTGRFFGAAELEQPVCVIGNGIRKDLFEGEDPLGKTLTVNGIPLRVMGTLSERSIGSGMLGGEELDAIVYMPLPFLRNVTGSQQIHRIFLEYRPGADPELATERVKQTLLARHRGLDDFSVVRAKELLAMFYKVFTLLSALLIGITSISLVVGGIGIMNVMLVTVTERTHEIGIRKTVGARRSDIFIQFLFEAIALSLLGGAAGIGLAFVFCKVVVIWLPLQPIITGWSVGLGFTVCVLVGVLSGVSPAMSAARKDPIDAVRYE